MLINHSLQYSYSKTYVNTVCLLTRNHIMHARIFENLTNLAGKYFKSLYTLFSMCLGNVKHTLWRSQGWLFVVECRRWRSRDCSKHPCSVCSQLGLRPLGRSTAVTSLRTSAPFCSGWRMPWIRTLHLFLNLCTNKLFWNFYSPKSSYYTIQ